jgi:hypothetical protein
LTVGEREREPAKNATCRLELTETTDWTLTTFWNRKRISPRGFFFSVLVCALQKLKYHRELFFYIVFLAALLLYENQKRESKKERTRERKWLFYERNLIHCSIYPHITFYNHIAHWWSDVRAWGRENMSFPLSLSLYVLLSR